MARFEHHKSSNEIEEQIAKLKNDNSYGTNKQEKPVFKDKIIKTNTSPSVTSQINPGPIEPHQHNSSDNN